MLTKILLSCLLLLLMVPSVTAQVQFSDLSFKEALQKAKATDKIILLQIESVDCGQCNDLADVGFSNAILGRSVNNSCITLKIKSDSKEMDLLDSLYQIKNTSGIVFIDSDGNFLSKYSGSSSYYLPYMQQLDKALTKKEHPDTEYIKLKQDYQNGIRDFDLVYKLVAKKSMLDLDHDDLTDELISIAPKDSAGSLTFLQFIAEQYPVWGSKADQYMHKDNRTFQDAWYLMPNQKRSFINNRINYKSKRKAIKEKDIVYAMRVASNTAATYSDRSQARKSYEKNMLDYYKGVKDSTGFLNACINYYDQYLMSINVDSVKTVDSIRRKEAFNAATLSSTDKTIMPGGIVGRSVQYAPITQYYTSELNDGAWTLYTFTRNLEYTNKALSWAKRATEFIEEPGSTDTYARLLYRAGKKEEAILMEEKALKMYKERRMPLTEYESVLTKMRNNQIQIDKY